MCIVVAAWPHIMIRVPRVDRPWTLEHTLDTRTCPRVVQTMPRSELCRGEAGTLSVAGYPDGGAASTLVPRTQHNQRMQTVPEAAAGHVFSCERHLAWPFQWPVDTAEVAGARPDAGGSQAFDHRRGGRWMKGVLEGASIV